VLKEGATQVEIRLTVSQPVTAKTIVLRAGEALSPPIEIKTSEEKP
jgi:hypothetical protein